MSTARRWGSVAWYSRWVSLGISAKYQRSSLHLAMVVLPPGSLTCPVYSFFYSLWFFCIIFFFEELPLGYVCVCVCKFVKLCRFGKLCMSFILNFDLNRKIWERLRLRLNNFHTLKLTSQCPISYSIICVRWTTLLISTGNMGKAEAVCKERVEVV